MTVLDLVAWRRAGWIYAASITTAGLLGWEQSLVRLETSKASTWPSSRSTAGWVALFVGMALDRPSSARRIAGLIARKASPRRTRPGPQFRRLTERLAGGLPPALVVRGEEGWYRHQAGLRVAELAAESGLEVCHRTADPEFRAPALLDDLAGGALFSGGRLVLVRGAGELLRKGSRHCSEGAMKAILARIERPGRLHPPRAEHARRRQGGQGPQRPGAALQLPQALGHPAAWRPDPRNVELVQWILGRARERGLQLKPEQAVYVTAATGNDLAALDGQLERAAQSGEKLEAAVVWDLGPRPGLAEKLVDGQAARAVMGLESLFRGGFVGKDGGGEGRPWSPCSARRFGRRARRSPWRAVGDRPLGEPPSA